jgi:hypothetical protein
LEEIGYEDKGWLNCPRIRLNFQLVVIVVIAAAAALMMMMLNCGIT